MTRCPRSRSLTAVVPMRSAGPGETAELYRMTRNVALIFNGIVDSFLTLVDTIRSYPPTTRHARRTHLGSVPGRQNSRAGWCSMVITRDGC